VLSCARQELRSLHWLLLWTNAQVRFVLVGNKTDLPVQDEHSAYRTEAAVSDVRSFPSCILLFGLALTVCLGRGQLLTEYPHLKHVQTSAKENVNVCTAFEELVEVHAVFASSFSQQPSVQPNFSASSRRK
jgi:GTPase SAR1 family protein